MWLVRVALKHPYTFVVMSMLIVLVGTLTIVRMPKDIFPDIDIPVVSVVWNFGGMQPQDLEQRIVNTFERNLTTTVNDIEHVESQTLTGISVIKIFLQPGASVEAATAQITAISQTAIRQMPAGTVPPLIIQYSAANVPIMQLALSGEAMSEQQLFDLGTNFIRADLATVQGAQLPWPYGGKQRQIMIDIDPQRLYSWGLSPRDVNNVLGLQNVIVPSGTAKMGGNEYPVLFNGTPEAVAQLEDLPIKTVNGTTVFIRDVASVRDGNSPQTSMVHVAGKRALLMSILKNGSASTLDVARRIKEVLPQSLAKLTKDLKADLMFDQSLFVEAAVEGVAKEAGIAAALTALMILLFLGSWRATLIVVISIPLSILVSIVILHALGMTLNVMTLGGLSLAVGILVDDATVEIENIHRNMAMKKPIVRAIMDGAQEIAAPAFVATLCICIVFVPVTFITGAAKSLFVPLALSVVFAMLTSYFLSRTVVPTLVHKLLAGEAQHYMHPEQHAARGAFARFHQRFEHGFDKLRDGYGGLLAWALTHRVRFIIGFAVFALGSSSLLAVVGSDFFPTVDAGLIKLHVRGAPSTRIEQTERDIGRIEAMIKSIIPEHEIASFIDNLGVPYSGINLSLSEGALISPADGQIMIALKEDHAPTADYVRKLRQQLGKAFPEKTFFFLAPDISTQVLNFGLPAPIDIQVVGPLGRDEHYHVAQKIAQKVRAIPGAVDVHLAQVPKGPQLRIDVDRSMAARLGLTQRDVASDLLVSLSSSGQVAPNYWVDPRGVQYLVAVQTPQYRNDSIEALAQTPLSNTAGGTPQLLSNIAAVTRAEGPVNITHYNVARTYDVQCSVEGTDLGTVAAAVRDVIEDMKKELPRGVTVKLKGQAESMDTSFRGLAFGLIFAVVLVYLLLVVNFQSWLDPFIILMALPGALAGISWMLFLSHTTISVPALMGAIMTIGVATANSILVVTFANEQRPFGFDAYHAALAAGMTRLRPVMMTALAMIIGMLPMSLGLGEGGEQNAPLGRAVIGGLLVATVSTLFFVPVMYSILRTRVAKHDPDVEAL
ncbi:MAG TPA: efflux RND transporter permease subunit [Polyangiales bacterium]|nr:efflux RND transporter permease subunit [Polyangiales bacterium]